MEKIIIHRESNLVLMARKFQILINGKKIDTISDGETKEITLPDEPAALTIKIMLYESKPVVIGKDFPNEYIIKMNFISNIFTYLTIFIGISLLTISYIIPTKINIFWFLAMIPLLLGDTYFYTFGRRKVIQVTERN